jgi:hypothetical protein
VQALLPPAPKRQKYTDTISSLMPAVDRSRWEQDEAGAYLSAPPARLDANPFDWWRKNTTLFPKVALLARRYLAVPATSIPCEQLFSVAGAIITKKRNRLHHMLARKLIFLYYNHALFARP